MRPPAETRIYQNAQLLAKQVRTWQNAGEEVVFTNGVFDILHAGHIRYLEDAAQLGDRLVIAVNDDASVKRLKGTRRCFFLINNVLEQVRTLLHAFHRHRRASVWIKVYP